MKLAAAAAVPANRSVQVQQQHREQHQVEQQTLEGGRRKELQSMMQMPNDLHRRLQEADSWIQRGQDIDGETVNDHSEQSVSTSADGTVVAIGAIFNDGNGGVSGRVRAFEWNGSTWTQRGLDIEGEATGDFFGVPVSLSSDGTVSAVGAPSNDGNGILDSGYVRVLKYDGSTWIQRGLNIDGEASEDFSGFSVSLSSDGTIVAVGAPFNNNNDSGHVRVLEWNGSTWTQRGLDIDGEAAGDLS
jgi:hypothetical protein